MLKFYKNEENNAMLIHIIADTDSGEVDKGFAPFFYDGVAEINERDDLGPSSMQVLENSLVVAQAFGLKPLYATSEESTKCMLNKEIPLSEFTEFDPYEAGLLVTDEEYAAMQEARDETIQ